MKARRNILSNLQWLPPVIAAAAFIASPGAHANELQGYGFESAAQEITQLFWLAETANVCGWATRRDADWFKLFSMRFLSDHLSEPNRVALVSMVTQDGYDTALRQAAEDGAGQNCSSRRWQLGWASYLAAAATYDNELNGETR
jgi:hypothetical protein